MSLLARPTAWRIGGPRDRAGCLRRACRRVFFLARHRWQKRRPHAHPLAISVNRGPGRLDVLSYLSAWTHYAVQYHADSLTNQNGALNLNANQSDYEQSVEREVLTPLTATSSLVAFYAGLPSQRVVRVVSGCARFFWCRVLKPKERL